MSTPHDNTVSGEAIREGGAKHTPGPWKVSAYHKDIVFADGEMVCAMHRGHTCFAHEQANETSIANAHLAAAAPDLKAGCADALRIAEQLALQCLGGESLERVMRELDGARAAIAKARGQ